jgi:hypothetical protein
VIDRDAHVRVSAMATGPRTSGRPSNQFISSMPHVRIRGQKPTRRLSSPCSLFQVAGA